MQETDVVVVGAGAAGLGAATALKQAGRRAVVLEGSGRAGGRAWTIRPPGLDGAWVDMGAIWLHAAEHNPLVPLAQQKGLRLMRSDALRQERTFIGNRPLTAAEQEAYDGAWERFETMADRILESGDAPLSAVASAMPDDPWAVTVESWEGPVIDVADAALLSLRDWRTNALNGSNLVPEGGLGAFVAGLAEGLDVRFDTPVRRVRWDRGVTVETAHGALQAKACIVTVSTGVLASGAIVFDPALPDATQACVNDLPMGLAVKVLLGATGPDRLDLPDHCSVDYRIEHSGDPLMVFQCWPFGRPYVQGWIGGSHAWALAEAGEGAVADFALERLRRIFGGRVDRVFAGGVRLVSHWDADPWIRGAYSYAGPGRADARAGLGQPLGGGRLLIAGEACNTPYAGTLAGAWLSGQAAAARVAA